MTKAAVETPDKAAEKDFLTILVARRRNTLVKSRSYNAYNFQGGSWIFNSSFAFIIFIKKNDDLQTGGSGASMAQRRCIGVAIVLEVIKPGSV